MRYPELHETLVELVTAVDPGEASGLGVDRVEITVPLETWSELGAEPRLLARVPHSRWDSGFMPEVQFGHLVIERDLTSEVGP